MSTTRMQPRRVFLGALGTLGTGALLGACRSKGAPRSAPVEGDIAVPAGGVMPTRTLGRTGVTVSLLGLGGFHIGAAKDQGEATRIIHRAIDHGVTFLDNCWDYNDGRSEQWMGQALRDGHRAKVYLMTKLDGRTKEAATRQLEQSLQRLQTDVIDLVQIHEVIRANDPARVFSPDSVLEALTTARQAGKIRHIGFTGHKDPDIHLAMLRAAADHGFVFDTVQMPLNVMDVHYKSFAKNVLPVLQGQNIGVLGMKPLGSGILLESKTATATECLHYAMNLPTSVVITGCESVGVLDQALHAAMTFRPLATEQVTALLARTAEAGANGRYEKFKTSQQFDGTVQHPKWLEGAVL